MVRWLLVAAAAAALMAAVALVLVPFRAELEVVGRNGRPVELSVGVDCPAPILDIGSGTEGDPGPWEAACQDRARTRSLGGLATAVVGSGLLAGGLGRRSGQARRR